MRAWQICCAMKTRCVGFVVFTTRSVKRSAMSKCLERTIFWTLMSGDRGTIWVQGVLMTREHYRQRLLVEQQKAFTRLERAVAGVSDPGDGPPHDTGDESSG